MEKDIRYNQVNPLVRAKEGELLTKNQWQEIQNKDTLEGLRNVLSATVYAPFVKEPNFAEKFEDALKKRRSALFAWAYEVAPEPELVDIYTLRYTFHNLKVFTKADLTGQNLDHLYVPDGRFDPDMLKSAVRTQASSILPDYLLAGISEVMNYFHEGKILQGIDIIYDRIFLTVSKQLALKLGYPELIEEVESFIDLTNITIMGRGIIQRQTPPFLTTVLSSSGSIPKSDFLAFSHASLKEYTDFVLNTKYKDIIAKVVKEGLLNVTKMAVVRDDYLTQFYAQSKTMAFGPLPLLAFLNAKEIEEKNLRLFVTGLNNGFSKEMLAERMRAIDAL